MLSKTQQNESGLSQHKQGSLISMSDRLLEYDSSPTDCTGASATEPLLRYEVMFDHIL